MPVIRDAGFVSLREWLYTRPVAASNKMYTSRRFYAIMAITVSMQAKFLSMLSGTKLKNFSSLKPTISHRDCFAYVEDIARGPFC